MRHPVFVAVVCLLSCACAAVGAAPAPAQATAPALPPGCTAATHTLTASPALAIPDNAPAGASSTINVTEAQPLRWVRVRVDIPHTFSADLDVTLVAPDGTQISLTTDNGGGNDNVFAGTLFDDDATDTLGVAPLTDSTFTNGVPLATVSPEEPLSALAGKNPLGTWTLKVVDDGATDVGTLQSWTLEYETLTGGGLTQNAVATSSGGAPIPDNGTLTRQIDVTTPLGGVLESVQANLDITHTFNGDLDITLTSPAGTTVTLSTDNGGSNDNVFAGTTFKDDAGVTNPPGPITDTTFANLVAETPIAPEEPLGAFRGEDPHGTWTLTVTDDTGGDTGTLVSWGLTLFTASCGPETQLTGTSAPATVPQGGAVAYALTARNRSTQAIEGATVALPLPPGMELVSASPSQGACTGTSCTLGKLVVESSASVTYVARATASGPQAVTAALTHSLAEPLPADNSLPFTTTVEPPPPPTTTPPGGTGTGTGTTPPPARDTLKPTVVALLAGDRLGTVARRGLRVTLAATEAGRLKLALTVDAATSRRLKLVSRTLGTATATLRGPGSRTLTIRLSRRAAKALGRARTAVRTTLAGTLTDPAGNAGKVTVRATLRR